MFPDAASPTLRAMTDLQPSSYMSDYMSDGEILKRGLRWLGIKQAQAARALNVTPSTISHIVAGRRNLSPDLRRQMADMLRERARALKAEAEAVEGTARLFRARFHDDPVPPPPEDP